MIRAVKRFTERAMAEVDRLEDMKRKGGCEKGIIYFKESFIHESTQALEEAEASKRIGLISNEVRESEYRNLCLVFEPLGKSLREFVVSNKSRGKPFITVKTF